MGLNDAAEMLDAAKAECVRLERALAGVERERDEALVERDARAEDARLYNADVVKALGERDEALAVIAEAPHDEDCAWEYGTAGRGCDCWKSAVPGDVLDTHDAEVRKQTRAGDAAAMLEADLFRDASSWAWWLRARGDMGPASSDDGQPSEFAGDIAEDRAWNDSDRGHDERAER